MAKTNKLNTFLRGLFAWILSGVIINLINTITYYQSPIINKGIFSIEIFLRDSLFGPILIFFSLGTAASIIGILVGIIYFIYGFPRSKK